MKMNIRCGLIPALAILACSVQAQDLDALRNRAEGGDATAQSYMGLLYHNGFIGDAPDYKQAVQWWEKAAQQGDPAAQYNLGVLLFNGTGTPVDYKAAFKWFIQAAKQGRHDAANYIGLMYEGGKGLPQDLTKAAKWYRMAAEQGEADAQNNLGVLYINGNGVPQDLVEGYAWIHVAAILLQKNAKQNMEVLADMMTPEQLARARAKGKAYAEAYIPVKRIRIQHLLIVPDSQESQDLARARNRAISIRHKIIAGAPFGDVAREYSDCPSKDKGGDLGYVVRGVMQPAFEAAAFALNVDDTSDIVQTTQGYHIIKRTE